MGGVGGTDRRGLPAAHLTCLYWPYSIAKDTIMAEIEDRLLPCDGLNNYNVFLKHLDLESQGTAQFTFSVTHSMLPIGEFLVAVPHQGQSLDRLAVDAHDGLLDILRQLMFRADKARTAHLKQAERFLTPPPPPPEPEEDGFLMDPPEAPEDTTF